MARESLTGSRIRERRQIAGLRQAELARQVGISASYINLIEHNRRRIGGKLLLDIARVLEVDPALLTDGAEAALVTGLRNAVADGGLDTAEVDRAEEFAGRFPGWAAAISQQHQRVRSLEQAVETLSDRFNRDPYLAESLHEVLSTAAAIRSTAAILAETDDLTADWRDRFHRNLDQDSRRLADSSKSLVTYLDENAVSEGVNTIPQEEAESFIFAHQAHFPSLETGAVSPQELVEGAVELTTDAARQIVVMILSQYESDARAMPLAQVESLLADTGPDPLALCQRFGVGMPAALRRLAALPSEIAGSVLGLVVCDASGSILFRKQTPGFALPRFGESCPLWPLYGALGRPMTPLRQMIVQPGREQAVFDCIAFSEAVSAPAYGRDPVYRSTMLIRPLPVGDGVPPDALPVGVNCRICPRSDCTVRREPSLLS